MSEVVQRWEGVQAGFRTTGHVWEVVIEPEPNTMDVIARGQRVVVLTPEGVAEVERAAAARALEEEAENLFKIIGNQRAIFQVPAATQMNRGIHLSAERLRARAAEIRERKSE